MSACGCALACTRVFLSHSSVWVFVFGCGLVWMRGSVFPWHEAGFRTIVCLTFVKPAVCFRGTSM